MSRKIQMVKSYLIKENDPSYKKGIRFNPLHYFYLWEYYMENHYDFKVIEKEVSLWIDSEYYEQGGIFAKDDLEEVTEITLFLLSQVDELIVPVVRYFPKENYDRVKQVFLSHFSDKPNSNIDGHKYIKKVVEVKGYWVKTKSVNHNKGGT